MIYAGSKGYLDNVAVADVQKFEAGLLAHLRGAKADLLNEIRDNDQKIKGEIEDKIKAAIEEFAKSFA